jgi:hypothetical protein
MYSLYDVKTQIPSFVYITTASLNDINFLHFILYERSSYYIFDRGSYDFERLYRIQMVEAYFVPEQRRNSNSTGCTRVRLIKNAAKMRPNRNFTNYKSYSRYPEKLRRIKYNDIETNVEFVFLTNNFELSVVEIAILYKNLWLVELFFKWLKKHLKIKKLLETYTKHGDDLTLLCNYLQLFGRNHWEELKINRSTYETLQL